MSNFTDWMQGLHLLSDIDAVQGHIMQLPLLYKEWWLTLYHESPQHIIIETGLLLFIIWLMFIRRTVDPTREAKNEKLSNKEIEWLIDTWEPEPLGPPLDKRSKDICDNMLTVEGVKGNYFLIDGVDTPVLNLATFDFIGSSQYQGMKTASEEALHKYGCGSCGPRGFYGTIDVHLELENAIAEFMKTEEAIYYSDGASTVTSTIPAFSKRGDLIIMDEACNDAICTGVELSRSTVVEYRHNDMAHLREILESIAKDDRRLKRDTLQQRRFIVTEGLFQQTGDICPLPTIMQLKEEFFYRLILDESLSFGVMGATGRGVTEHFNIDVKDVEIITVAVDTALASVGGLCIGSHEIVDHQRLSGAGYCFSAAAPPFLAAAALSSLQRLATNGPSLITSLQKRAQRVVAALKDIPGYEIASSSPDISSPVVHFRLKPRPNRTWEDDEAIINKIVDMCLFQGVGVTSLKVSSSKLRDIRNKTCIRPSVRICVSTALTLKELDKALAVIKKNAVRAIPAQ
mmetsp:Transcript_14877/g.22376  ORF Transcript_14877/g.22376 Transcript_14877/m.22376 type:complete len:515 (+) Transcript_14877:34-1578(+)